MRLLKQLRIDEVSVVLNGANPGAKVMIRKSDGDPPYLFNDIMRKADVSDPLRGPRDESDDKKLSAKLDEIVAEMIVAAPSLHPNRARRWLLHTPQGRELLSKHTTKETIMPRPDILKLITVLDDGLMAQARLSKRADESDARSYSRLLENDSAFRRQCIAIQDAKHMLSLPKGMASLEPTSTSVGDTNVSDDSAEAVRLLGEMAAKNGQSFESVFSDPANAKLAARTYTGAHRSNVNTDYLQG